MKDCRVGERSAMTERSGTELSTAERMSHVIASGRVARDRQTDRQTVRPAGRPARGHVGGRQYVENTRHTRCVQLRPHTYARTQHTNKRTLQRRRNIAARTGVRRPSLTNCFSVYIAFLDHTSQIQTNTVILSITAASYRGPCTYSTYTTLF